MSIKSLVSFVFTCAAAAVFVLFTAGSGQALELCVKADRTDPTEPRVGSKIKLRSVCKPVKEVLVGTTDDLEAIGANSSLLATLNSLIGGKADQAEVDLLSALLDVLEVIVDAKAELPCASQVGNDVYFEGCNVHVLSGSGATDGAINGLGNLVVGYNEDGGAGADGVVGSGHG